MVTTVFLPTLRDWQCLFTSLKATTALTDSACCVETYPCQLQPQRILQTRCGFQGKAGGAFLRLLWDPETWLIRIPVMNYQGLAGCLPLSDYLLIWADQATGDGYGVKELALWSGQ